MVNYCRGDGSGVSEVLKHKMKCMQAPVLVRKHILGREKVKVRNRNCC
jgi:hypothetical protein